MTTYNPAMQKANPFDDGVEIEKVGRIVKRTAKLDGLSATLVTFAACVRSAAEHEEGRRLRRTQPTT